MCESTFQPMNAYLSLLRSLTMNHNTLHTADACFVAVGLKKPEICGFQWRCSLQPVHWWLEVGGLGSFTRWVLFILSFITFLSSIRTSAWCLGHTLQCHFIWVLVSTTPEMMIPVEFHVYKAILVDTMETKKRLSHVIVCHVYIHMFLYLVDLINGYICYHCLFWNFMLSLDPHINCCVCYLHFFPAKNHGPGAMPGASPSECAIGNAQSLAIARTARKQCRTGGGKCLGCGKNGCEIPGKHMF